MSVYIPRILKRLWRKNMTIEDLANNRPRRLQDVIDSFAKYRSKFKILIIDDNKVPISDTLKSLEYVVSEESDIRTPMETERYDLVLCDKNGVGKALGSSSEGVFLAKKIKERYPFKPVILYSSSKLILDDYKAIRDLDDIISDAPDVDTFSEYIDDHIKHLIDPIWQWHRLRLALVDQKVPTRQIVVFEDDYVRQICEDSKYEVPESIMTASAKSIVKDIFVSFASQAIFNIMRG